MQHISEQLGRHQNIILEGFDPVSSQGFTQVPNFILKSKHLSVGAKITYSMLLSYAWQNNFCFPGQETLSVDIGVSRRSVVTFIKELQQQECIKVKRQGLNKPNIYTLCLTIKGKSKGKK